MGLIHSIAQFFEAGGKMMLPILLIGLVGLAIAIERWVTIARTQAQTKRMWARVEPSLSEGDFDKAREIVGEDNTPLGRLLGAGLSMQGAVRRRDDVEKAMQEGMMEIVPRLEKRTHYLGTFANLATLVGLLGTVSGPHRCVQRRGDGQPGGEGQSPVGQHLRSDELHGVRPWRRRCRCCSCTRS
jgi:biopolymer transport protein ExbB